jgi:ankyrin repeat protein
LTIFADLLAAIARGEATALRLIRATPAIAQVRVSDERFVTEISHQLYVGDTALHVAAAALQPLVVEALLHSGADANAENRRGARALHYACDARPNGTMWNPARQRAVIEGLLKGGADIEHTDKAGATPLHRAIRARSADAVRCLLERGARANATHGTKRTTPLDLATRSTGASGTAGRRSEQQEIVQLLLHYGATPEQPGRTTGRGRASPRRSAR